MSHSNPYDVGSQFFISKVVGQAGFEPALIQLCTYRIEAGAITDLLILYKYYITDY
jgi:hypothetical protein